MAKKKIENQINLLPQEEFDASTLGRTLKWLLGTFRYLVISTEMVVMVAFLSRFWLDARSNDLIDSINQKKAVIASYSSFEKQFRNTQKQLSIFKKYSSEKLYLSPLLTQIAEAVPANASLTEISVNANKVTIGGQANDEFTASNFVSSLNSISLLHDISLISVESKKDSISLSFTIDAKLNERNINGQ